MDYTERIRAQLGNCLVQTSIPRGTKRVGKVRDRYELGEQIILVTTDRQSAFDRVLAAIPFKGQALNQTSAWWFERTRHIVYNHVVAVPDPNVTIAETCAVFPIEFVVRGYITGTTSTALWTHYAKGARSYCGNVLPEGLLKNQRLERAILTPTTKAEDHDRPISPKEIVEEGWMRAAEWEEASAIAFRLFAFGQEVAAQHGLVLVDTKYEMGRDSAGRICLVDEIHTPDSSRYWIASSYAEKFARGEEPENIDKEFLRLWFVSHCDPYNDSVLPPAPEDLVLELSRRYIQLFERITGAPFSFPDSAVPIEERIRANLAEFL